MRALARALCNLGLITGLLGCMAADDDALEAAERALLRPVEPWVVASAVAAIEAARRDPIG